MFFWRLQAINFLKQEPNVRVETNFYLSIQAKQTRLIGVVKTFCKNTKDKISGMPTLFF